MSTFQLTPWDSLSFDGADTKRREFDGPLVSFLIWTRNHRDRLLKTLEEVQRCGLNRDEFEVHVVDNASTDGTPEAVAERFPLIQLLTLAESESPLSGKKPITKSEAISSAKGKYIVFLDDNSYPHPASVERMVDYFEADSHLGAAVFTVTRPDGTREASSFPNVLIACGTGFRRAALEHVGGLPDDYSTAGGEEYALSLRLLAGGWKIKPFSDLHVTHLKPLTMPEPRIGESLAARAIQFHVEKQLNVVTRYFPRKWVLPYAKDWLRHHRLLAQEKGHELAYFSGLMKGLMKVLRPTYRRPLNEKTFEALVRIEETQMRLQRAQDKHRLQRILFLDLGKNMLAFWNAARQCGLDVVGIADARLGGKANWYRGVPVLSDEEARKLNFDAAVVCQISPIWSAGRRALWETHDARPVIELFNDAAPLEALPPITSGRPAESVIRQTVARSA